MCWSANYTLETGCSKIHIPKQSVREEAACQRARKKGHSPCKGQLICARDLYSLASGRMLKSEVTTEWWVEDCGGFIWFFNSYKSLPAGWPLTFIFTETQTWGDCFSEPSQAATITPWIGGQILLSKSLKDEFSKLIDHGKKKKACGAKSALRVWKS